MELIPNLSEYFVWKRVITQFAVKSFHKTYGFDAFADTLCAATFLHYAWALGKQAAYEHHCKEWLIYQSNYYSVCEWL